jgi:alpha-beta hydrolase superfamily lysophospholipase
MHNLPARPYAIFCTAARPWLTRLSLAILAAVIVSGCASKSLQEWHTTRLKSEFSTKDIDTITSFADYQHMEDLLFKELKQVYLPNTPGNVALRYSEGSAADPTVRTPNWNRSFILPAQDAVGAVLLLHGMSDSPYSLRQMALALQEKGYTVLGLRMPGHGTAPSGMVYVHWQDMAAAVNLGMSHLNQLQPGQPIHIVGYSTGATLALDYALNALAGDTAPEPASLVLISPAIGITAAASMAKVADGLSVLPGLKGLAWSQVALEYDPYKYNSFTTNAADQVHKVTRSVSKRIKALSSSYATSEQRLPPILVFKSTTDATVSTNALVDNLLLRLDANRHELVLFDINRSAGIDKLLVTDPAPLTDRLIANTHLPVALTLISNRTEDARDVVAFRKLALEGELDSTEEIDLAWPAGIFSLSHVALPFSPDDPLYGDTPPEDEDQLFLGNMSVRGERGVLKIPSDSLLRLRNNPFYPYLEQRAFAWIDSANQSAKNR